MASSGKAGTCVILKGELRGGDKQGVQGNTPPAKREKHDPPLEHRVSSHQ